MGSTGSMQDLSLSQLHAVIIGAGFGGLGAAIELRRKGASVQVLESFPDMKKQGDVIMLGSNATRIIKRWGDTLSKIMACSSQPSKLEIADKAGKALLIQDLPKEFGGHPNAYTSRGLAQQTMYEYAVSIGVKVEFGARVTEVYETANGAGVRAGDVAYEGDFVIAADGVHGRTRAIITGIDDRPKKSGFAVYRSWFSTDLLKENPATKDLVETDEPVFKIWIAEDTHAIVTTNTKMQRATCFLTHKDTEDIKEDWNLAGNLDHMQQSLRDWDPLLSEVAKMIPADCLIDYKLLWRDPVKVWISKGGRIALVGDAAHPHLATSGQGGAQAIEDATTIAALLERSGGEDISTALRAYARLRYERTSLTQRMGWETRHVWHQTDWEAVAKSPDILKLPQPAWLNGHDAEQYAYDNYDQVLKHVVSGEPFASSNIPEGHVHEDWTIEHMLSFEGKQAAKDFYKTR